MELSVTGVIEKILPQKTGQTKDGKEWVKQDFLVRTDDQYNNLYCFGVFGAEKVENLNKYNKEGQNVTVKFNVSVNHWNDPKTKEDKYFTSLNAWRIDKAEGGSMPPVPPQSEFEPQENDMPF